VERRCLQSSVTYTPSTSPSASCSVSFSVSRTASSFSVTTSSSGSCSPSITPSHGQAPTQAKWLMAANVRQWPSLAATKNGARRTPDSWLLGPGHSLSGSGSGSGSSSRTITPSFSCSMSPTPTLSRSFSGSASFDEGAHHFIFGLLCFFRIVFMRIKGIWMLKQFTYL
jgi:hypothetical protein